MPLTATQGGLLNFNSSVALPLNAEFFFPGKNSYSEFSFGNLVAGDYSYIAATQMQDADAVRALFGNLSIVTEGLAYELVETGIPEIPFLFGQLPNGAVPLVDGALVSVIPDATPGGANQLINPIDDSPITTDVFGNPRTNVLGFRDIGAVQVQGEFDDIQQASIDVSDVVIASVSDTEITGSFCITNASGGVSTYVTLGEVFVFIDSIVQGDATPLGGTCVTGAFLSSITGELDGGVATEFVLLPNETVCFTFSCTGFEPTLLAGELKATVWVLGAENQLGEFRDRLWRDTSEEEE